MVDLDLPALPLKISTRFWGGWVLYGLIIIQVILGGRVGTIISKSLSDFLGRETVPHYPGNIRDMIVLSITIV